MSSVFIEIYDFYENINDYPKFKIPNKCLCGCNEFDELFNYNAQLNNLKNNKLRQFANSVHLKRYKKLNSNISK